MKFKDAVTGTEGLTNAYHAGLQGLKEADRNRVKCRKPRNLSGSVGLDETLRDSHRHANRWDYGIGVVINQRADRVIWVEVHPASFHHVDDVLMKHHWLKQWLVSSAPLLSQMEKEFIWIASGKVSIPSTSPQRRKIAARGIKFVGQRLFV